MSEIHINAISSSLAGFLDQANYTRIAVLVDENTKSCCYPLIQEQLPAHELIEIRSGGKKQGFEYL